MKGNITVVGNVAARVAFTNCIRKIDGITVDGTEDLHLVMPMYHLLENSSNYSNTTGSLSLCSKDEADDFVNFIVNNNALKFFKYKPKLIGSAEDGNGNLISLKYLAMFGDHLEYHWLIVKLN